jgi:dynein heavy chain
MQNRGKKQPLPLTLEPILVAERHSQLFGEDPLVGVAAEADSPKRGIFSEFLLLEAKPKKPKILSNSSKYPSLPEIQKAVSLPTSQTFMREKASYVTSKTPLEKFKVAEKSAQSSGVTVNYRKAIEPRVARPFINRLDQTPRKIEMERKKRLYSSLEIKNLIDEELDALKADGGLPHDTFHSLKSSSIKAAAEGELDSEAPIIHTELSKLLPLEAFDDTQFDVRTVDDWLDMTSIPDDAESASKSKWNPNGKKGLTKPGHPDIRFAVVPLPAKAFDGLEWRDCIVIAYDDIKNLWKIKWRSYNGWELDKKGDFIHPEDEGLQEEFEIQNGNPRELIDGKELWTHR